MAKYFDEVGKTGDYLLHLRSSQPDVAYCPVLPCSFCIHLIMNDVTPPSSFFSQLVSSRYDMIAVLVNNVLGSPDMA